LAICSFFPQPSKHDSTISGPIGGYNAPPSRQKIQGRRKVSFGRYKGGTIHHSTIGLNLAREAIQGISLCLNFYSADVAVDYGDIHT
jgi:hypothetical protein